MSTRLLKETDRIKKDLLSMGAVVEEHVERAVGALRDRDERVYDALLKADDDVDRMEVELEEECLKVLALHQPVAHDLRFIVSVLKINGMLERIGDLSVSIARRAAFLAQRQPVDVSLPLSAITAGARDMLRRGLDCFVNMDPGLAREVCAADVEVDRLRHDANLRIYEAIRRNPEQIEDLLELHAIVRHIERLADHATSIAEDVIYMVEGEIVRHRPQEYWARAVEQRSESGGAT